MPRHNFPPRGYFAEEYPLQHDFIYKLSLSLEDTTSDSTIVILSRFSERNVISPELVQVNPSNGAFAECNGPLCHQASIIPRMSVAINAFLSEASILEIGADRPITFNWMPIYTSFLSSLEAEDDLTGLQVEDILELAHVTLHKETTALYVSDLPNTVAYNSAFPLTTEPADITDETFDDYGLGVDTVQEEVAFDKGLYYDMMKYGTNKEMLAKVAPHMNTAMVSAKRPWRHFSNKFTYPSVKRMNPYTMCAILFHLPQSGDLDQPSLISETSPIQHLFINVRVRYEEWNPNFDQTQI